MLRTSCVNQLWVQKSWGVNLVYPSRGTRLYSDFVILCWIAHVMFQILGLVQVCYGVHSGCNSCWGNMLFANVKERKLCSFWQAWYTKATISCWSKLCLRRYNLSVGSVRVQNMIMDMMNCLNQALRALKAEGISLFDFGNQSISCRLFHPWYKTWPDT
jgi:hypothetical protein